jgi:exodeoxyribonuclease VII large subunit
LRAPTPTGAAELASAGYFSVRDALAVSALRLRQSITRQLETLAQRTDRCALRLNARIPAPTALRKQVDGIGERLDRAVGALIDTQRQRLDALSAGLRQLNPDAVLTRGYSIVRNAEGHIVRTAASLQPGDMLAVQLAEGGIDVTVKRLRG